MSRENVKVARELYRAWNRGDPGFAYYTPDVEWDVSRWAPDLPDVARGHDEVRDQYKRFLGMWDELHFEPERFIEQGDALVVPVTINTRGKGSGVTVASQGAVHAFTFRDGLVASFVLYPDLEQALEAVASRD
jgi:ketosteroid isomerase-like protein